MLFYVFIFLISCLLLLFCGEALVGSLARIARYLEWKEFVVAFVVVAIATSIPNLFVGITSALHGVPQLSLGDIIGGNLFDLTFAVAIATFIARGLSAESRMVQASSIFTIVAALLPLVLFLDGTLSRGDGIVLISLFFFYILWLFSKKERFAKVYDGKKKAPVAGFKIFVKDMGRVLGSMAILILAAEGIVRSATFFAEFFNLPLVFVGIFIIGIGSAIPETYFVISAARKGETWMILGNLMGSVVVITTLVLGTVVLIHPITTIDLSTFAVARIFVVLTALFFFYSVRSGHRISRKEAGYLLAIYIFFVLIELLFR